MVGVTLCCSLFCLHKAIAIGYTLTDFETTAEKVCPVAVFFAIDIFQKVGYN